MKVWELEVNKIYKRVLDDGSVDSDKFKIDENRKLYVKDSSGWRESLIYYNKLLKIDFEEYRISWEELEKGTKVQVSDNNEDWENRYFVEYQSERNFPFTVTRCREDKFTNTSWQKFSEVYKYCRLYEED